MLTTRWHCGATAPQVLQAAVRRRQLHRHARGALMMQQLFRRRLVRNRVALRRVQRAVVPIQRFIRHHQARRRVRQVLIRKGWWGALQRKDDIARLGALYQHASSAAPDAAARERELEIEIVRQLGARSKARLANFAAKARSNVARRASLRDDVSDAAAADDAAAGDPHHHTWADEDVGQLPQLHAQLDDALDARRS